jgi:hypothetical protein
MRFLLDTNILIPLEDSSHVLEESLANPLPGENAPALNRARKVATQTCASAGHGTCSYEERC